MLSKPETYSKGVKVCWRDPFQQVIHLTQALILKHATGIRLSGDWWAYDTTIRGTHSAPHSETRNWN